MDLSFVDTTREIVAFKPDAIYLKDQGGLLTVDRLRTLHTALPLLTLLQELGKHKSVHYVHIRRGEETLAIDNRIQA